MDISTIGAGTAIIGVALQAAPKPLARYLGYPLVILGIGVVVYGLIASPPNTTAASDDKANKGEQGNNTSSLGIAGTYGKKEPPPAVVPKPDQVVVEQPKLPTDICLGRVFWRGAVFDDNHRQLATNVEADFFNHHYSGHDVSIPNNNFDFSGDIVDCTTGSGTVSFSLNNMRPYKNDSNCSVAFDEDGMNANGHCDTQAGYREWKGKLVPQGSSQDR